MPTRSPSRWAAPPPTTCRAHLDQTRVRGLGLGWGTTLRETIRHLRGGSFPDLSINSMMGGLTHGLELNTFEIASEFARRINGQCNYLAAPIYAGSPKLARHHPGAGRVPGDVPAAGDLRRRAA